MLERRGVILASVVAGVVLELAIQLVSGRREAWDSQAYWAIGVPAVLVVAAVIGFLSRGRAWVWTFLIVPGQVTAMMARSGEIGTLWPLTAALSSLLSVPFVAAAFLGSRFRRAARPSAVGH
jgi:NAD/NADP transhydrogenase beta subunit